MHDKYTHRHTHMSSDNLVFTIRIEIGKNFLFSYLISCGGNIISLILIISWQHINITC